MISHDLFEQIRKTIRLNFGFVKKVYNKKVIRCQILLKLQSMDMVAYQQTTFALKSLGNFLNNGKDLF